jgi:hypothetical protein
MHKVPTLTGQSFVMGETVMIIGCKSVRMIVLIVWRGEKQNITEYCLISEDELCNNRTASITVHLFTLSMHSSKDEK